MNFGGCCSTYSDYNILGFDFLDFSVKRCCPVTTSYKLGLADPSSSADKLHKNNKVFNFRKPALASKRRLKKNKRVGLSSRDLGPLLVPIFRKKSIKTDLRLQFR